MNATAPYRRARLCSYLGMFIQAIVINLIPLLFIPLREQFGLTFEQVGRLILINFTTQLLVDLACCALNDTAKVKPLLVLANLLAALGLILFALSAWWWPHPYAGFVFATVIFSAGCGLLEVLLSPVVNAIPSENKSAEMALLHAYYPIGKVAVILVTASALALGGIEHWPWIMLAWALVPIANTFGFSRVTLPPFVREENRQRLRDLCRAPDFWLLIAAMIFAGGVEVTLAQWSSAYAQVGLGYGKFTADMLGFGFFGAGMILGRLWFGLRGQRHNLVPLLLISGSLSAIACLVMALSPSPAVALAACASTGLLVSMLWPGTISLTAERFPQAGTSMFAFLAAAGDGGCALFPWIMGYVADHVRVGSSLAALLPSNLTSEQTGLHAGILLTTFCPLLFLLMIALTRRNRSSGASLQ